MNDAVCPICGFSSSNLTLHIKSHNLDTAGFRLKYPGVYLRSKSSRDKHSHTMKLANPMSGRSHSERSKKMISEARSGKGIGICGKYERTSSIRSKISTGVTKAHLEGRLRIKGIGSWAFSEKNNKWMWLASSYEARVFEVLENNPFFLSFEREPFAIEYKWEGCIKHYIPDFLVITIGNIRELWEIKPSFKMKEAITCKKLQVLNDFVMANDMNGCWLNEKHISSLERTIS